MFNGSEQKAFRQQLRRNMTEPERRLWQQLRHEQLGVKFRRQHGIGHYIADFYCPSHKLVIEVDGESHFSTQGRASDGQRDQFMHALGLRVMRFTNQQIMHELAAVLAAIMQACHHPLNQK
ncbi:MAG: endonuclease domain-containing protein [Shewanella sp.]